MNQLEIVTTASPIVTNLLATMAIASVLKETAYNINMELCQEQGLKFCDIGEGPDLCELQTDEQNNAYYSALLEREHDANPGLCDESFNPSAHYGHRVIIAENNLIDAVAPLFDITRGHLGDMDNRKKFITLIIQAVLSYKGCE
jgi:hypothetical protein